jgi:hypothetical protein
MAKVKVSVVHKLTGEIVAVSTSTASIEGLSLTAIALSGPDESVIETEVEENDLASLLTSHIVEGQQLRAVTG